MANGFESSLDIFGPLRLNGRKPSTLLGMVIIEFAQKIVYRLEGGTEFRPHLWMVEIFKHHAHFFD